jgi:hypothetical protein
MSSIVKRWVVFRAETDAHFIEARPRQPLSRPFETKEEADNAAKDQAKRDPGRAGSRFAPGSRYLYEVVEVWLDNDFEEIV